MRGAYGTGEPGLECMECCEDGWMLGQTTPGMVSQKSLKSPHTSLSLAHEGAPFITLCQHNHLINNGKYNVSFSTAAY